MTPGLLLLLCFLLLPPIGEAFRPLRLRDNVAQYSKSRLVAMKPTGACHRHVTRSQWRISTTTMFSHHPQNQEHRNICWRTGVKRLFAKMIPRRRKLRSRLAAWATAMMILVESAVAAPDGGRVGGTMFRVRPATPLYSRADRSSSSNRQSSSCRGSQRRSSPPARTSTIVRYHTRPSHAEVAGPNPSVQENTVELNKVEAGFYVACGAAGVAHGMFNGDSSGASTPSTPPDNRTVGSITVALAVPDRRAEGNILNFLRRTALKADTVTRAGLAELLSEVALELLRQQESIVSAYSKSSVSNESTHAELEFHIRSVKDQSKFDKLLGKLCCFQMQTAAQLIFWQSSPVNKFGSEDKSETPAERTKPVRDGFPSPTLAIVTLNFVLRSVSTGEEVLGTIQNRADLEETLASLAANACVANVVEAAEVLWSPENATETLQQDDAYKDFPELVPL